MTGPLMAAQQLGKRLTELSDLIDQLRAAESAAILANHEADLAEWREFLTARGPVEQRKIQSRVEAEGLRFAADNADALVRHLVRQVRLAERRVEVGRTYSADLRAELAVIGRDGTL